MKQYKVVSADTTLALAGLFFSESVPSVKSDGAQHKFRGHKKAIFGIMGQSSLLHKGDNVAKYISS